MGDSWGGREAGSLRLAEEPGLLILLLVIQLVTHQLCRLAQIIQPL